MSRLASRPIPLSPSLVQLPLAYRRQLSVRMKALREYKQGCLLFVLPDYLRKAIVDWTLENIPDFHLAVGGRELRPHITVVYGFDYDVGEQIKQFLQDTKPFSVRLTELGVFPEGKDGVPFFAKVESPELQRLHYSVLEAFGVEDKHPNYQPHITLGYLRPEVAESYLNGKPPFLPSTVTLDQLEFSTADNHVTSIPLSVLPLLGQKSMRYEIKSQGEPCKQGEAASRTGCIPASPSTGQQGTAKKPPQKASGNANLKEAVQGYNRALAILKRSEPDSPGYRKLKDDVAKATQKLVSERNKAKEPAREETAKTPSKKKTLRERAAQMKERYRKIKEKVKEGGKKAVEKAGKATVATQSFFRNLSEKYLGKAGTEVAEAVIGAVQETINTILLGEDELPEDPAGWGVNIATNLIPDMVAWAWRVGRKWATGVDPRDVKYPRKSLPEGIDLDGIADMLLELQSQYEKDGLDFEPLDKDGILELLQRSLRIEEGESRLQHRKKSLPHLIKMEEHRDRGGRRYCTEEGEGIVPCGEQRTTEEGDAPGTKPSPAPAGEAPRKLGGESSRSYQQEAQRSQRREERKEQRKQERSQLPSIKEVRQEALDELHEHSPEEQKQLKKRMSVDLKKVIEAASKKVRDTRNKVAAGVDMVKDVSKELAKKVGEKAGLDEQQTEELTKKFGSEAKERFDDLLKKGDLPDDINDIFTLKSVIRWAPEIVRILYRQARIALTGVDPRTVPSKHVRRQQEQERRQEMKRQQRRKKRDERRKQKAERSSGRKSLSWLAADRGGALVPPPATGKKVPMNRSKIAGRKLLLPVNRVKTWEDCNAERFGVFLSSLKSHPLPRYPEDEIANQVGFALSEARGQLAAILAQYGRNDVMGLRNVLDPNAWHRVEMALDEVRRLEREYADLRERNILMRGEPRDNAEAWAVSEAFSVKLPPDMANAYVEGRDDADRAEWVPVSEIKNRDIAFDHRDILKASGVGPENVDPGFTGTDSLGREWRNGELVAKQEELTEDEEADRDNRLRRKAKLNKSGYRTVLKESQTKDGTEYEIRVGEGEHLSDTYIVLRKSDLKEIGRAGLSRKGDYITTVRIDDEYQRQGIGSTLYDAVEENIGQKLRPSPHALSPKAEEFWRKRGRRGHDESPTDDQGYSQIDDVTGERRTPEEQEQYRRDIQEMNRQPREVARELIENWNNYTTDERRRLQGIMNRHLEAVARNREEEDAGRELTEEEVEEIRDTIATDARNRRPRELQKLIREMSEPRYVGSTANELKAELRKIRERGESSGQEAPKQRPVKMERVTADNEKMKQAVLDAGKHWAREFGIFDFGEQRYADAMKRDAQTGYSRFATSPDGEYVGHMLAHPMGDLNELAGERGYTEQTPYVRNIMAAPNARKTGASRQLLNDFADRILKDPNLPDTEKRVVLDTPITNQQAVEYYDKLGFDRAGTFKYGDNEFYRFEIPAQKLKENTKPREAKQESPTAAETPPKKKPRIKPSPFKGRKNPASRKAAAETGATEVRRDYDAIKADLRNITVDDMRNRFSDAVAGRSKEELSRALESLGYNTAGLSRQRIVDHLLDNLTSIKISLDQTEQIRNAPR